MLFRDYGIVNGQTLPGPFAYFLGSKERIEYFPFYGIRYPCSRVTNADLGPAVVSVSADRDRALSIVSVTCHIGYSVGCIDDQVQNHLVELALQTGDQGQ